MSFETDLSLALFTKKTLQDNYLNLFNQFSVEMIPDKSFKTKLALEKKLNIEYNDFFSQPLDSIRIEFVDLVLQKVKHNNFITIMRCIISQSFSQVNEKLNNLISKISDCEDSTNLFSTDLFLVQKSLQEIRDEINELEVEIKSLF